MKIPPFHLCKQCGNKYFKKSSHSKTAWEKTKFCSMKCLAEYNKSLIPWNKGKHPDYLQGNNHPFYGKHHTLEARQKIKEKRAHQVISESQHKGLELGRFLKRKPKIYKNCVICNKEMILCPSWSKKKCCSTTCYGKYQSIYFRRENARHYIHGEGYRKYKYFTEKLKSSIRVRDKFTCQICGTKENGGVGLSIHHIDYDKTNHNQTNLVSLCRPCHAKTNDNRDYWKKLLQLNLLNEA